MSAQPQSSIIPFTDLEMIREGRDVIRHEAQALFDLSSRLDVSFCAAVQLIQDCRGFVLVTGMGKAGLIGRKITATLSSTGTRALFLHPAEAVHGDIGCAGPADVVLALSNSGETEELLRLLPILQRMEIPIIAMTARETSTLGIAADVTLTLGQLPEAGLHGLPPTTSTTAMLGLGDALALVVSNAKGFTRQQFAQIHPAGALGQRLQCVGELMRQGNQLRITRETATIREVLVRIRKPGRRTGAVMIVDDEGKLSGLFTDSDLVRLLEDRRESQVDRPICEEMTVGPKTVTADAPLVDAIDILSRHRISELPVIDADGRPVGLLDITDVVALMPEGSWD